MNEKDWPYIRPFHQHIEGMEDLYHTYCPAHPDFGTCSNLSDAHAHIASHLDSDH